jgi:hypothetical protein
MVKVHRTGGLLETQGLKQSLDPLTGKSASDNMDHMDMRGSVATHRVCVGNWIY